MTTRRGIAIVICFHLHFEDRNVNQSLTYDRFTFNSRQLNSKKARGSHNPGRTMDA
jgi:hypothetical protein